LSVNALPVLQRVSLDVSDGAARRQVLHQINAGGQRVLILTEGLLIYLTPAEVASLARDLHQMRRFGWWLSDLVSSDAISLMEQACAPSADAANNVKLLFAPKEGSAFFDPYGWQTAECRSCYDEGQRLDRWFVVKTLASAHLSSRQREVLRKLFSVVKLKRTDWRTQD
jgi:O-methyltransferase involved in polyketide biosynthesis